MYALVIRCYGDNNGHAVSWFNFSASNALSFPGMFGLGMNFSPPVQDDSKQWYLEHGSCGVPGLMIRYRIVPAPDENLISVFTC